MTNTSCIFCKIIGNEISAEIIYQTDDFIAIVDIAPANFGHSLLIPKVHFENIHTLPANILEKMGPEIKKLSDAIKRAVNADGISVIINNGEASGQVIFHSHIHIVPRFLNDGFHWWPTKKYENSEKMEEIGEKIRKEIE